MVYRIYVEKKQGLRLEAQAALSELRQLPDVHQLDDLRLLNRYDVEGIDAALFERCRYTVFAEPQTDLVWEQLPEDQAHILAVEYLPGQFDQRADSASQCVQLMSQGDRPLVRTARVYLLYGQLDAAELSAISRYLINPVECRQAALELPATLHVDYPDPPDVPLLFCFCDRAEREPAGLIAEYGLAMDAGDLACCAAYFRSEQREPTLTELKVLDTYWSDHCRHTTFATELDQVRIDSPELAQAWQRYLDVRRQLKREKPVTLMDMATIATRWHKAQGLLPQLDESPEINACTVKVKAEINGQNEDWLLLFKNETHNHPTEIEPFGGAATCLGGAIRDPLSGRAFVYQAMRVTGAADPRTPLDQTLPGKLPQRKLVTTAAAGYSSYGNQIGIPTGLVRELYHPGYAAKRMEVGAVIGAVPAANVVREIPQPGDVVLLVGGPTGRDGCGGATGSSKAHDLHSIETCGAEVQKGNAPEERKLLRLFRRPEAARLIRRCNDFGAGGVSVAIGELADGLDIQLDAVPKKYAGLDGTELAISESQERMACVVAAADAERFARLAAEENIQTTQVAVVTAEPRLVMHWRGQTIVDLSRTFLDTNGAAKHAEAALPKAGLPTAPAAGDFAAACRAAAGDLNVCGQRGLIQRFDSSVGSGSVLSPLGGKRQLTPTQVMAARLPAQLGESATCSLMSYGFDPALSSASPFHGAYLAVASSVAKLLAAGAPLSPCYLSFQEYFPRLGADAQRWGLPVAALLGALEAQLDLGLSAIGGKDSMSGSFEQLDVPPTLISFAVSVCDAERVLSPEFKQAGSRVIWLAPKLRDSGLPQAESLREVFRQISELTAGGHVLAAAVAEQGGIAAQVMKMCFGNDLGFSFDEQIADELLFDPAQLGFIVELDEGCQTKLGRPLGRVTVQPELRRGDTALPLDELLSISERTLADVYPTDCAAEVKTRQPDIPLTLHSVRTWPRPRDVQARPLFAVPAFPGTNCEYDTARAIRAAGGEAEIFVVRNLSPADVADSAREFAALIDRAQGVAIPGGFSGGDEPDGSGKFIAAFFRSPQISDSVARLLEQRDGLMCGICNGFQALIKLGLVPGGVIRDMDADCPTITFNAIGRHQARLVRTRIISNKSPWLMHTRPGEVYTMPISHGEGRFICGEDQLRQLILNGQVAAEYVDELGLPSESIESNPNGSLLAVEAITSPDGRVIGKMGHMERNSRLLYKNVPGNYEMNFFRGAVDYFRS